MTTKLGVAVTDHDENAAQAVMPAEGMDGPSGQPEIPARLHLHQLREMKGLTQRSLGLKLEVQQPAVAKMERRSDMYVSNLRAYVEALGGNLRFVADFPDGSIEVHPPGTPPQGALDADPA